MYLRASLLYDWLLSYTFGSCYSKFIKIFGGFLLNNLFSFSSYLPNEGRRTTTINWITFFSFNYWYTNWTYLIRSIKTHICNHNCIGVICSIYILEAIRIYMRRFSSLMLFETWINNCTVGYIQISIRTHNWIHNCVNIISRKPWRKL